MFITVMAEPRSGSTNLANWFYNQSKFTTLFEPITSPNLKWFKNGICPTKWEYSTEHIFVKEIYQQNIDYSKLLSISDKVIVLYRENDNEQLLSLNNAMSTGNWHSHWRYTPSQIVEDVNVIDNFKNIKMGMKAHFINNPNYFTTTYEKLYKGDGFVELLEYLSIDGLDDIKFPRGVKYAIDTTQSKTII